jgi:hypothetical protein
MANHIVTLTKADGILLADTGSVPVVTGDTLTIGTDDGSAFVLFFSPDATAAVLPNPETAFEVPQGTKAVFTLNSSGPGAYTVFYGPQGSAQPASFPPEISTLLYLISTAIVGSSFGGPGGNDNMTTGR